MFYITKHARDRFKERVLNVSKDTSIEHINEKIHRDYHNCQRNFEIYNNKAFINKMINKFGALNFQFFVHPLNGHFYIISNDMQNDIKTIITVVLPWDEKKRKECKELCYVYENIIKKQQEEKEAIIKKKKAKETEFYMKNKPHIENVVKEWNFLTI